MEGIGSEIGDAGNWREEFSHPKMLAVELLLRNTMFSQELVLRDEGSIEVVDL